MTVWEIIALLTPVWGALGILCALHFFPVTKAVSDQFELDLDVVPGYLKRSRAAAHDAHRAADTVREETSRLKAKPRIKR